MKDFGSWLHNLTSKPLPGGVSAAALAAAMGAALVSKAVRTSLPKQDMSAEDRKACKVVLELASSQQQSLLSLAKADERAYRAVLEHHTHRNGTPAVGDSWQEATEVPVCVAEACHLLLRRLPRILDLCWPPVKPDLQIGQWLLEVGLRAGLTAAESNVRVWADSGELDSQQARIDALKQAQRPEQ